MSDFHVRSTCRLCASDQLEPLLTLPDTPLANEYPKFPEGTPATVRITDYDDRERPTGFVLLQKQYPLYLVGCSVCGHVQLPVVVDPKRLFPPDYPYQSGTSAVFRRHLVKLSKMLVEDMGARDVLDVACNDGTLVAELRCQHIQASGVDPCAPYGATGMHRGFFTAAWAQGAHQNGWTYDCITALNVFAHVDDLDDFTRGVHTLLEPCGLFVVEVGYLPDVVKRGAFDTIYHEHLSYHHLSPLVRFFKKHGMRLVDAERIDSQGGSIRLFVRNCDKQHQGGDDGHNEPSARLQDLLDEESRSALWNGVRGFKDVVRGADASLHQLSRRYGKLVVYGAPAKLTTLLHATDKADNIAFVVDDNPNKVGRYVPGTRIPIKPVSAMYEAKPPCVVIASWNFAEAIMEQHKALDTRWVRGWKQ